jgi:hypothetical protein
LGWEEVVEFAEVSGCRCCPAASEQKNASGIISTAASFI